MTSNPPPDPRASSRRFFRAALGAALLIALPLAWASQHPMFRLYTVAAIVAFGIAFVKPVDRWVGALVGRFRYPSRRERRATACLVALIAGVGLYVDNTLTGRGLFPRFHDEHSYILQTRMLAQGKLWLPAHEVGASFESMHLLVKPVYTSIYFPGTALVNLPMAWLDLPYWLIPLLLSALAAGLLYRVIAELVDGVAGLASTLILFGSPIYRQIGVMVLSQTVMLALGLLMLTLWLRWRRTRGLGWALLLGLVGGLALVTRPIETLALALPIGIAMLLRLRRDTWARIALTLVLLIVPTFPFLALQAIHNRATSGHWGKFASDVFVERNYPASMMGFRHPDFSQFKPQTPVPAIRASAQTWVLKAYQGHTLERLLEDWRTERFPGFVYGTLFSPALLSLAAMGVLMLYRKQRWVVFVPVVLTLGFYAIYVFYISHYGMVMIPAMALVTVLAPGAIGAAWPRFRRPAEAGTLLACLTVCLAGVHSLLRGTPYDYFDELATINRTIDAQVREPAIVLFRFANDSNPHVEPVYNITTPWPDDAKVIRAHDIDAEHNQRLLNYYARTQPSRHVYRWDRAAAKLQDLGNVADLARTGISGR